MEIKFFQFENKDLLITRSSTDGFQPKFITRDRQWFVKGQAVISHTVMEDWLVEIIATDFCKQLGIPVIEQKECEIAFANKKMKGVYSRNFELDGYSFISLERLLERVNLSSKEDYFIRLDTVQKMEWIAKQFSEIGKIPYQDCIKYVVNLAVVDCLVGNIDRHTKNLGLFYKKSVGFCIPLLFDNGMGLFENDYYRDNYKTYEEAMRNVYVSPYGEDPVDMWNILCQNFDLSHLHLRNLQIPKRFPNEFSKRYIKEILNEVSLYERILSEKYERDSI